jgi:ornithine cyclodeaminase/alanine dehydrogenase-like protein (mu-crystallin family)
VSRSLPEPLMALLLREADVHALLTIAVALEAVEESFRHLAEGSALLHPRHRFSFPEKAHLHYMAAADLVRGCAGLKVYTWVGGKLRFLVLLYRIADGELLALIEADNLSQMRTGAASGVATKYMAREDAAVAGVVGTGWQARAQLEAIAAVRKLDCVRAFGRDPERRARFARDMSARLGVAVEAAASAEEAVREADIVVTATTSSTPVVLGAWIAPGAHINAIGANFAQKRELDAAAIHRAGIIAVDSREQARLEAGDLIQAFGEDVAAWSAVRELTEIVAGGAPGRTSERQITLFKSNGIAIWDIAVAWRLYGLAKERGAGERLRLHSDSK